jgi:bacterioferritin (cytochrome b1)
VAEKSKGQSGKNEKNGMDTKKVIDALNTILEFELAGVVRYTHYSLMVYGHNRIPIVSWLREQAAESLAHAAQAGGKHHDSERPSVA